MSDSKSASGAAIMAHLFALYGWMSWHFWNHIAATVIWTLAVCFLLAYIMERAKGKKSE